MPKQLDTVSRQSAAAAKNTPAESTSSPETATTPTQDDIAVQPQQDEYSSLFPEPGVSINPPPNWIWWLLVLLGSLIIGAVGYQYIRANLDDWLSVEPPVASATPKDVLPVPSEEPSEAPEATPSVVPSETPTPTATPSESPSPAPSTTPSFQKASVSIRVLNGTTKAGAAAAAQKVLVDNGFTVRTIGNAKNQTYTQTNIYYQTGHLAEAEAVKDTLSSYKPVLVEDTQTATPDIIAVVVGP